MARLDQRLTEAHAAFATFEEAVGNADRSLVERDSAILRLIYTFEAIWKACQQLLVELEGIEVASPNGTIRAARGLGWLSDEDAEAAIGINRDRNLAVHMYRGRIGEEIEQRLAGHAAVLRRWLFALNTAISEERMPSDTYRLFEQAMIEEKQIICEYDSRPRELCPIILGHSSGKEKVLTYQFAGESTSALPPGGDWRCLFLEGVTNIELREGDWKSGSSHAQPSNCVTDVDLDVNPDSPYRPRRSLQALRAAFRRAHAMRDENPKNTTGRRSKKPRVQP